MTEQTPGVGGGSSIPPHKTDREGKLKNHTFTNKTTQEPHHENLIPKQKPYETGPSTWKMKIDQKLAAAYELIQKLGEILSRYFPWKSGKKEVINKQDSTQIRTPEERSLQRELERGTLPTDWEESPTGLPQAKKEMTDTNPLGPLSTLQQIRERKWFLSAIETPETKEGISSKKALLEGAEKQIFEAAEKRLKNAEDTIVRQLPVKEFEQLTGSLPLFLKGSFGEKMKTALEYIDNEWDRLEDQIKEVYKNKDTITDQMKQLNSEKTDTLPRKRTLEEQRNASWAEEQVKFQETVVTPTNKKIKELEQKIEELTEEINRMITAQNIEDRFIRREDMRLEIKKLQKTLDEGKSKLSDTMQNITAEMEKLDTREKQIDLALKELQKKLDDNIDQSSNITSQMESLRALKGKLTNLQERVSRDSPELIKQWLIAFVQDAGLKEFSKKPQKDVKEFWWKFIEVNKNTLQSEFEKKLDDQGIILTKDYPRETNLSQLLDNMVMLSST